MKVEKGSGTHVVLLDALKRQNKNLEQAAKILGVGINEFKRWINLMPPKKLSVEVELRLLMFTGKASLAEIWPPNAFPGVANSELEDEASEEVPTRTRRRGTAAQHALETRVAAPGDPHEALEHQERMSKYNQVVKTLPPEQRILIEAFFFDEIEDMDELADLVGLSMEEAFARLKAGHQAIRKAFGRGDNSVH